jgi:acyl carrier protein phosphodiesterase
MNWLAHLFLAEPTSIDRVASLIPDLMPMTHWRELPAPFQPGIERHRQVDAFTDRHPIFRRSVARLQPPFRRFGAVYTDVFYDHMLTVHWQHYTAIDLDEFIDQVYASFNECRDHLPSDTSRLLQRMRLGAWLQSYGDMPGIRLTLERMSHRLRRPFDLAAGVDQLETHYVDLQQDFHEFFPELLQQFNIQLLHR